MISFSKKGIQKGIQDDSKWEASKIPNRFQIQQSFQLFLVGLDGGIKARYDGPTTPQTIFGLIDTMPMRQAELRYRKSKP